VFAIQKAKAKPSAHNALTIRASEAEIGGGNSTVEVVDDFVVSLLFRRSMEEDLRTVKFRIELKQGRRRNRGYWWASPNQNTLKRELLWANFFFFYFQKCPSHILSFHGIMTSKIVTSLCNHSHSPLNIIKIWFGYIIYNEIIILFAYLFCYPKHNNRLTISIFFYTYLL